MVAIVATDVKCVDGLISSKRRDERHRTKWEMVLHIGREWQEQRCWQPSLLELLLAGRLVSLIYQLLVSQRAVAVARPRLAMQSNQKIHGLSAAALPPRLLLLLACQQIMYGTLCKFHITNHVSKE